MRILISGASGFIGRPLVSLLKDEGHEVIRLTRKRATRPDEISWNIEEGKVDREQFEGFDAVINLSGESLFSMRWTQRKKSRILISREQTSIFLAQITAHVIRAPKIFISASAVGYYGDRADQELDESALRGQTYLSGVCARWEAACTVIKNRGARVVHPRFGIVLGKGGGVLQAMRLPYLLGLGGKLGAGSQWVSWIALEDAIRSISFALSHPSLEGPYNATSPYPVQQKEFAERFAQSLHRKALFSYPKWLLRLGFGEMANELLLASTKAYPKKLLQAGFEFQKPTLDKALEAAL